MQGGRVTASSSGLGRGSEFAVKLPVLAGGTEHKLATTPEPGGAVGAGILRVLVVEDNVDAGDSLSMLLRLHGHEVLVAWSGPTALEVAAGFHPALVLMDIGLPGMDGVRGGPADAGRSGTGGRDAVKRADRLYAERGRPAASAAGGVRPPLRQADRAEHVAGAAEDARVKTPPPCSEIRRHGDAVLAASRQIAVTGTPSRGRSGSS